MEAKIGGKANLYSPVAETDKNGVGKRSLEWDLNDWKWDGNLFRATPLNSTPLDCRSKQPFPLGSEPAANTDVSNSSFFCLDDINRTNENGKREMEKRRLVVVPDEELNDEAGPLNLKLGEQVYPVAEDEIDRLEGRSAKKSRAAGTSRAVCQVEDCRADLSKARDYHRRHRVCEKHTKASEALVRNVKQRFCQQCSKFHALEEFDEEKRSCHRRLTVHNKRRRKKHPETSPSAGPLYDEKIAGFLLINLLKILPNLPPNASNESKDQDLISHLLRNLAGQVDGSKMQELHQGSQSLIDAGISLGTPEKTPSRLEEPPQAIPSAEAQIDLLMRENQKKMQQTPSASQPGVSLPASGSILAKGSAQDTSVERHKFTGIDLNYACIDSEDINNLENGNGPIACASNPEQQLQKSSPPQISGNSDSTSGCSSSSGSETQGRTDRIVFKLFGKDPNELPHLLRSQILDWLSHSPTDIEGYIRPGCIVLTIYLRLNKALWDELCYDMSCSLSRLLSLSNDPFWKTGWIYTRVQQHAAFICDGRVVLDTPLPFKSRRSQISSISPIAVPAAKTVQLLIKGSNISGPTSRLLCAIEGNYLVQENCYSLMEGTDTVTDQDEIQSLSFSCSIPDVVGRGFIEVEDYGLSGCFFPFIVAEPEICSEICMLERILEVVGADEGNDGDCSYVDVRNDALDFIHEMGWLLHRNRLNLEPDNIGLHLALFPFERLKRLIQFAMDHDWSAVLRKLLDFLFTGTVDPGNHDSVEYALAQMTLLHNAVQRNNRPMVEFLLRYSPQKAENASDLELGKPDSGLPSSFFFRPDDTGSNGLTPLHIAASCVGFENVLDALLEDPGMVGIGAWEKAQDSTGLTPRDYACLRGHNQYIDLFERKISKSSSGKHVVVDIVGLSNFESKKNQSDRLKSAKFNSFSTDIPQVRQSCKLCEQKSAYGFRRSSLTYRPAVMSLVAITVVCVCTALLFKSMPRVCYIFGPFRWDSLKFGAM